MVFGYVQNCKLKFKCVINYRWTAELVCFMFSNESSWWLLAIGEKCSISGSDFIISFQLFYSRFLLHTYICRSFRERPFWTFVVFGNFWKIFYYLIYIAVFSIGRYGMKGNRKQFSNSTQLVGIFFRFSLLPPDFCCLQ